MPEITARVPFFPVHTHFFLADGILFKRADDRLRCGGVAAAVQGQGNHGLHVPAVAEPEFSGLPGIIRIGSLRCRRYFVFGEETPQVEILYLQVSQVVPGKFDLVPQQVVVVFFYFFIEVGYGLVNDGFHLLVIISGQGVQFPQVTDAGEDVLGHVTVVASAAEPGESPAFALHLFEFRESFIEFAAHLHHVEQQGDIFLLLGFVLRIQHPGCFFQ